MYHVCAKIRADLGAGNHILSLITKAHRSLYWLSQNCQKMTARTLNSPRQQEAGGSLGMVNRGAFGIAYLTCVYTDAAVCLRRLGVEDLGAGGLEALV